MRLRFLLPVALLLVLVAAAGVGAYAYDVGHRQTLAEGVRAGGVPVGGLTTAQARERVRRELLDPLQRPIVVRAGDRRFRLSAREARIRADVDGMVDDALRRSREGNLLQRTYRSITNGTVGADVAPRMDYSRQAVRRLVDRVRVRMSRPARSADVDFSAKAISVRPSRTGRTIDARALHRRVESVLLDGDAGRDLRARLKRVQPEVSTAELGERYPTVVTIDRGGYRLRLFKRLKLDRTYPIAVGKAGLETPAGVYDIQNKAVNPAWHVPDSDWAGKLRGKVIPPGPENPIKSRWLGIYAGAGIHGTSDRGSIGTNASHGCIRMLVEDVEALYDDVPVGAPVYIA